MRLRSWVPGSAFLAFGVVAVVLFTAGCPQSGAGGNGGVGPATGGTGGDGGTNGGGGPAPGEPGGVPLVLTAGEVAPLVDARFNSVDRNLKIWDAHYGLGPLMAEYGHRFAMMQLAAAAGDWWIAEYEFDEIEELRDVIEVIAPQHVPALQQFHDTVFAPLLTDILLKDTPSFNAHVVSAISACNNCHAATGQPIVIQAPTFNPQDTITLKEVAPYDPTAVDPYFVPVSPFAADKLLDWADLNTYIDFFFNSLDISQPLWEAQNGSGPLMLEYGVRFATLKLAADAGDWAMAQYQVTQMIDNGEANAITRPFRKNELTNFKFQYLDALLAAATAQDKVTFDATYAVTLTGCGHCHTSTGHQQIVMQAPTRQPQQVLKFGLTQPRVLPAPPAPVPVSYPNTAPTVDDAATLLLTKLNTPDTALGLWRVQPSLGRNMLQSGQRFAQAWFAGQAGNFALANYHLAHIAELFRISGMNRPEHTAGLESFVTSYLQPLQTAASAGDKPGFTTSYQSAIAGCNACHAAAGRDFIVVQTATQPAEDYVKP